MDNFAQLGGRYLPGQDSNSPGLIPGVVFCKTDYVMSFLAQRQQKPCVLITTASDYAITDDVAACKRDNVIRWFAVNCDTTVEGVEGIPLGLTHAHNPHGDFDAVVKARRSVILPENLLYCGFALSTNPIRRDALKRFQDKDWVFNDCYAHHEERPYSYVEYLSRMRSCRFVLSPPGNGVDCHRHWEALYLGRIPVCLRSSAMRHFDDLPILFVQNYEQVTPAFLLEQEIVLQSRWKNVHQLYMGYWMDRIGRAAARLVLS